MYHVLHNALNGIPIIQGENEPRREAEVLRVLPILRSLKVKFGKERRIELVSKLFIKYCTDTARTPLTTTAYAAHYWVIFSLVDECFKVITTGGGAQGEYNLWHRHTLQVSYRHNIHAPKIASFYSMGI